MAIDIDRAELFKQLNINNFVYTESETVPILSYTYDQVELPGEKYSWVTLSVASNNCGVVIFELIKDSVTVRKDVIDISGNDVVDKSIIEKYVNNVLVAYFENV